MLGRKAPAQYIYKPLRKDEPNTGLVHRLFVLHPARRDAHLCGELVISSVRTKYEVLSGCWDLEPILDISEPSLIYLKEKDKCLSLQIPPSLEAALRELRRPDGPRTFWISSICINQSDNFERSHHIPLFGQIHEQADRMCVWFGANSSEDEMAFTLIRELRDISQLQILLSIRYAEYWKRLVSLMRNRWFIRLRSVVEMAFSEGARIHMGSCSIDWTNFVVAAGILESVANEVFALVEQDNNHNNRKALAENQNDVGAFDFLNILRRITYKASIGPRTRSFLSLECIISTLSTFQTGDPRDTVHAALPLEKNTRAVSHGETHDYLISKGKANQSSSKLAAVHYSQGLKSGTPMHQNPSNFLVDYSRSSLHVYKEFVEFAIKDSNSLDVLCRPWAPDDLRAFRINGENVTRPSWACSSSKSPFRAGMSARRNGNTFIGTSYSHEPVYTASSGTYPDGWFFGGQDGHSLCVFGKLIGVVERCEAAADRGNIPTFWCTTAGWKDPKSELPPDDFWRTLVADRDEKGQQPPSYYSRACQFAFGHAMGTQVLNTSDLVELSRSQTIKDFVRRMQAVTWGRRLIGVRCNDSRSSATSHGNTTHHHSPSLHDSNQTRSGKLGLAPTEARVGDQVYLLQGCSVPVLIRTAAPQYRALKTDLVRQELVPVTQGTGDHDVVYPVDLVGECYIHGIMNGEARSTLVQKALQDRLIEIRR